MGKAGGGEQKGGKGICTIPPRSVDLVTALHRRCFQTSKLMPAKLSDTFEKLAQEH